MRSRSAAAVLLGFAVGGGCDCPALEARVERPGGDVVLTVCASEARSAEERMRGLAGHALLAHDEGLVLVFPVEGEVCIVNGGVDFAIDVVLADDAGTVVEVLRGVAAHDDEPRCREVVRRALELSAGVASPVALGDRLVVE